MDTYKLTNDYFDSLEILESLENFPSDIPNIKVAVIGAGLSGIVAGVELLKKGIVPTIYEKSNRIGGRAFTYRFKKDPLAIAELGAMRFPKNHKLLFKYLDNFLIPYTDFPDPLTTDTMVCVNGEKIFIEKGNPLPEKIDLLCKKWKTIIDPIVKSINEGFEQNWDRVVGLYKEKSLYDVLHENNWMEEEISLLGSIGIASGGLNSFMELSFLETIKMLKLHSDPRSIVIGGIDQLARNLWNQKISIGGEEKSLDDFNNKKSMVGVIELSKSENSKIIVKDSSLKESEFDYVILTCSPRAIELGISIRDNLLNENKKEAIRNLPTKKATKIFLLTKTAFWKSPEFKISTTITDLPIRQLFLFDKTHFGTETESGVILLSYTFGESSLKLNSLSETEKLDICLKSLYEIYGQKIIDKIKDEIIEIKTISWESEDGYFGAYKMSTPGQHHYFDYLAEDYFKNTDSRLLLAGEALAWYGYSGWVEGALQTGLRSVYKILTNVNVTE